MTTEQFHIESQRGNDSASTHGPDDAKINGVCQEFVTGMQFISRFSGKNNADQADVIRNNLKLLNKNLKTFDLYRESLHLAKAKNLQDKKLRWYPLSNNNQIQVGLMAISPRHRVQLHQERRTVLVPGFRLMLVLSGRISITQNVALIGGTANALSGTLKTQQSILITPQINTDLQTTDKAAILLYVHIPHTHLTPTTEKLSPVLVHSGTPSNIPDQRRRA